MKNIMITLGVLLTIAIVFAIPILFVCSIYEHWSGFVKLLLLIFMGADIMFVSLGIVDLMDVFE